MRTLYIHADLKAKHNKKWPPDASNLTKKYSKIPLFEQKLATPTKIRALASLFWAFCRKIESEIKALSLFFGSFADGLALAIYLKRISVPFRAYSQHYRFPKVIFRYYLSKIFVSLSEFCLI